MKKLRGFRLVLIVLITSVFVGCSTSEWHRTSEGTYIYCIADDSYNLVWEGKTNGCFAEGKGDLVSYNKEGQEKERITITTTLGVAEDFHFIPYNSFQYLGELDDDKPDGFGVLIKNDSVFIGVFEEGVLYEGRCEIYEIDSDSLIPCFIGLYEDGEVIGSAKFFHKGELVYEGGMDDGERNGVGNEYEQGLLIYEGFFKNGLRHGAGKAYKNSVLIYDGEWKKGKRDGIGKSFNERGFLVYDGEWDDDVYDGKGRLYENGLCLEGKWDEGRLEKTISSSVFEQIKRSVNILLEKDSLNVLIEKEGVLDADSKIEFVTQLQSELNEYLTEKFSERVEDRFGFLNLFRMIFQPWFSSDVKRADYAQEYFCENLQASDIQQWINTKIDFYNQNHPFEQLNYITLNEISRGEIVDTNLAIKIFDREIMELTDVIGGIVIDLIICWVIGFIIGFIIGLIIWPLLPFVGVIDAILGIIAFGAALYFSIFHTTKESIDLEYQITQMLVDNYNMFLESQNVVYQILGLL